MAFLGAEIGLTAEEQAHFAAQAAQAAATAASGELGSFGVRGAGARLGILPADFVCLGSEMGQLVH